MILESPNQPVRMQNGVDAPTLLLRLSELQRSDWSHRDGRMPLHCYFANEEVRRVADQAYAMFAHTNALAPEAFPSCQKMEREVVAMALGLLNGRAGSAGSMTSGGTESIILAVKAARDKRRIQFPQKPANLVIPSSAHPAFDKAAQLLGLTVKRIPVGADLRCDVAAMAAALDDETILVAASAPSLPYGLFDHLEELAGLAMRKGVWMHVDACIGGMLAPFVRELGYPVPAFDFALPGVRSISLDLHKFGYSAKGASLLLYRDKTDQRFQFNSFSAWPKGEYFTPTLAGTRSGGPIASAWAVMQLLGQDGYCDITRRLMLLRDRYLQALSAFPEFSVLGTRPDLTVITFTAADVDIFAVADAMRQFGWYMSLVAEPPGIQQTVNLVHEPVIDQYFSDLRAALTLVQARPLSAATSDRRQIVTY